MSGAAYVQLVFNFIQGLDPGSVSEQEAKWRAGLSHSGASGRLARGNSRVCKNPARTQRVVRWWARGRWELERSSQDAFQVVESLGSWGCWSWGVWLRRSFGGWRSCKGWGSEEMGVSGNTRTQSSEGGRSTEMWGGVGAHTKWLPARSMRGHLWGEGQEVLKGWARQVGSVGHKGVRATKVATWTLLTSTCGGKCTQDSCHTSLQRSLSSSPSQLHHHFCFTEQHRPYISKWKMREEQGPFSFSTVVW